MCYNSIEFLRRKSFNGEVCEFNFVNHKKRSYTRELNKEKLYKDDLKKFTT